ncbi:hypothetical protein DL546_001269 [Coniochaeta pulveracea]|uniref:2EXR domain-containing protein n=1 Tax=Coniochaeta pulveracea TaxID=177199 RepID=A0A420Y101_9PEZI|nr:hypothetical protein DL546_001269 [Coniochaeta pulveracea]
MSDFDDDDGGDYEHEYEDGGLDYDEAGSEVSDDEVEFDGFRDDDDSETCLDNLLDGGDDEDDLDEPHDSLFHRGGLFDLEASEDDSDSQRGADDESESSLSMSGYDLELEARRTSSTFHAFPLLPPELREMIWLAASSDLTAQSRVFDFSLVSVPDGLVELRPSAMLEAQTASARAVLATCRESRVIALKRLPDTLPLYGKRFDIRCNLNQDVIFLGGPPGQHLPLKMPDFAHKIRHLALDATFVSGRLYPDDFPHLSDDAQEFVLSFPHLETLYSSYYNEDVSLGRWPWFQMNELRTYEVHATEKTEYGIEEDLEQLYCWPVGDGYDIVKSMFPEKQIVNSEEETEENGHSEDAHWMSDDSDIDEELRNEKYRKDAFLAIVGLHAEHGFWHHPMTTFQFEEGMHLFKTMMRWKEGKHGHGGDFEPDEYESEGIDDDDISDLIDDDDLDERSDDLDISVMSGDDPLDQEHFDSENNSSAEDNSGEDTDTSLHAEDDLNQTELSTAHFSSPEPASRVNSSSAEEESPVQKSKQKRRLARVVESDPDSGPEDVEVVQVARRTKRRIVSSDSEENSDDGGASTSRPAKRARVILSDDDEDED